ncbi:MAG: hypothetical protein KDI71_07895 [Xanthomonadales bacterium]|nr:hypothetical protein [Xanthomonadales bacterium]
MPSVRALLIKTALFALYCAFPAQAAAPWHLIRTQPANPAPREAFLIKVEGTWPNGCPFEVTPVQLDDKQLNLRLIERPGVCTEALRPYELTIDPMTVLPQGLSSGAYQLLMEVEDQRGVRPIAFSAFDVISPDQTVRPEAGFWVADPTGSYPDSGSGVGFNLERQDDSIALITYFYDTGGEPRWYFSAGDAGRRGYSGDLLEIRGGQTLFQPYQPPREMRPFGRIDLSFRDRGHATAWFTQPEDDSILAGLKIMPISLVRFGFKGGATTAALAGRWVWLTLDGDQGSGTVVNLEANSGDNPFRLRLQDRERDLILDCGVQTEKLDQPPALCVLAGVGLQFTLDNNGINELRSSDGQTRLIRIDP